jgi:uncharacterized protein (TIGR02679 family)
VPWWITSNKIDRHPSAEWILPPECSGPRTPWILVPASKRPSSVPVLTWRLPLTDTCGLSHLTASALDAGIPLHLSRFALEAHPLDVASGSRILVVENPRIVEAAAQRQASTPIVSTNGSPSSTVLLLLTQLLDAGADLRYHGDFDTAGLAICERMMRLGLAP